MNIQELLNEKAEITSALKLIPFEGSIEIKTVSDGKYLYLRRRVAGKMTSTYIDKYSDELYELLLSQTRRSRELKKRIKSIEKQLASLGYTKTHPEPRVLLNLDFARDNVKSIIHDQAVLEGVCTTFSQTETILDNGKVYGVTATDVRKILNLKRAWNFILDKDVLIAPSDYDLLYHIAKLVSEGSYDYIGKLGGVHARKFGASYVPHADEADIKDKLVKIQGSDMPNIDIAVELYLYVIKAQIFNGVNRQTALIFANHYLIGKGEGLLAVAEPRIEEFENKLRDHCQGKDENSIKHFIKAFCHRIF